MSDQPTPEAETRNTPSLASILEPLAYHREIVDYLKTSEAELWQWFSSTAAREEYAATTRLGLLKACYRFDPADHADLYGLVDRVREQLGLEVPVTLYQSQNATGLNAGLCYIPGEVHLVLEGPIRTLLALDEQRAIVAHELCHYLLWQRQDGELLVADQMLSAMANHARAEPSHLESARLFRLYLEVHCDRAALAVSPDPLVAIAALVKVQTGIVDAQAESYLRQSEEIFGQAGVMTEGLTHPECFVRARALKLWANSGDAADPEIARMIEGTLQLGRLNLLAQRRLTRVTRRVLMRFLEPAWLQTESLLAHARLFFTDLDPTTADAGPTTPNDDLAGADDSVKRYVCYLLLDLATIDRGLEEAPLASAVALSDELGIADQFLALAGEELDLPKRTLTRLRKESAKIVANAAAAGPAAS